MRLSKVLLIAGAIGLLLWLFGRGRGKAYEYPEQPEPLRPWWNETTSVPIDDIFYWISS